MTSALVSRSQLRHCRWSQFVSMIRSRAFNLTLKELADWRGNRADAGRLAPKGFPKTNKFGNESSRPASGMESDS